MVVSLKKRLATLAEARAQERRDTGGRFAQFAGSPEQDGRAGETKAEEPAREPLSVELQEEPAGQDAASMQDAGEAEGEPRPVPVSGRGQAFREMLCAVRDLAGRFPVHQMLCTQGRTRQHAQDVPERKRPGPRGRTARRNSGRRAPLTNEYYRQYYQEHRERDYRPGAGK